MKTKILVGILVLPLIGVSTQIYADFDCSSIDSETTKTIMEKERSGETLTTEEQTLIDQVKTCMPQRPDSGSGHTLTDAKKVQMDEIKSIKARSASGETLTSEEQTKLDNWEQTKPQGKERFGNGQTLSGTYLRENTQSGTMLPRTESTQEKKNGKVPEKYQNLIDKKINALGSDSGKTDEEKIDTFKSLQSKLETVSGSIESRNLSDSQKESIESILDYFTSEIQSKIDELSSSDDASDDLNSIFNTLGE